MKFYRQKLAHIISDRTSNTWSSITVHRSRTFTTNCITNHSPSSAISLLAVSCSMLFNCPKIASLATRLTEIMISPSWHINYQTLEQCIHSAFISQSADACRKLMHASFVCRVSFEMYKCSSEHKSLFSGCLFKIWNGHCARQRVFECRFAESSRKWLLN